VKIRCGLEEILIMLRTSDALHIQSGEMIGTHHGKMDKDIMQDLFVHMKVKQNE
jgi:hypothetical protein